MPRFGGAFLMWLVFVLRWGRRPRKAKPRAGLLAALAAERVNSSASNLVAPALPSSVARRAASDLGGVLGQLGQALAVLLRGSDDAHFLPVIGKFSSAIEACDVSSGQARGLRTARLSTNGYGKAVVRVPAAE